MQQPKVTISIILNLLGVGSYITASGINYESLAIFCLVWGMGGAFISLLLSKVLAKWMMGVQIVEANGPYSWLVQTVHAHARRAGLSSMPEVGVYDSPEMNAFATGPTKSSALVAVSTGLINSMNRDEVEGVIGHEVAHVANGDMVTMTIIQGIINASVMFFARIAAYAVEQALRKDDDEERGGLSSLLHMFLVIIFEIVFGIAGMIIVAYFSRKREFVADADSAKIGGREKMIAALEALQRNYENMTTDNGGMSTLKISNKGSWLALFSTHPPLEDRIEALKRGYQHSYK
ncbi:MAG: protease HtpX [Oligoflexia bacterium]|nr:protease HtpX [Oligoflexia bacterium]